MTAALVGGAVLVVVALLALLARRNPGAAEPVPAAFGLRATAPAGPRTPALLSWEADLLAAATGGPRGRARLARRMEPALEAALRDRHGLSLGDDAAVELLGEEWEYLRGGPPPASARRLDVSTAVTIVLDRVEADRRAVDPPSPRSVTAPSGGAA